MNTSRIRGEIIAMAGKHIVSAGVLMDSEARQVLQQFVSVAIKEEWHRRVLAGKVWELTDRMLVPGSICDGVVRVEHLCTLGGRGTNKQLIECESLFDIRKPYGVKGSVEPNCEVGMLLVDPRVDQVLSLGKKRNAWVVRGSELSARFWLTN